VLRETNYIIVRIFRGYINKGGGKGISGSLATAAWHVLNLKMEEMAFKYGG
jgi:hypothetical protein